MENRIEKRLIAVLTILNDKVVQSIGYQKYLPIGLPEWVVENLNRQGVDEIILADISAAKKLRSGINLPLLKKIGPYCFTPVTYAGGISKLSDVELAITNGADKVAINSHLTDFDLIEKIVKVFGKQALIISLDFKYINSKLELLVKNGTIKIDHWEEVIKRLEQIGVGEFLIKSIVRDGTKKGLDIKLSELVRAHTKSPIIISSGTGSVQHIFDAFRHPMIDAVAVGNFLNYFEHSVPLIKAKLAQEKILIRENQFYKKYDQAQISSQGHLQKYDETYLEELVYLHPSKIEI